VIFTFDFSLATKKEPFLILSFNDRIKKILLLASKKYVLKPRAGKLALKIN
jgi:hypothetical protein